jgi:hypothetical protein
MASAGRRTWRYKTWGGGLCTVVAERVEFHPAHVVWFDTGNRVVLAETVANVSELSEVGNAGSSTRGVRPAEAQP